MLEEGAKNTSNFGSGEVAARLEELKRGCTAGWMPSKVLLEGFGQPRLNDERRQSIRNSPDNKGQSWMT